MIYDINYVGKYEDGKADEVNRDCNADENNEYKMYGYDYDYDYDPVIVG